MRLILKILAAPLVVALTLFVWICTILLYCTSMVLGLAALVVALLEQPHKISTISGTGKPVTTIRIRNSGKGLV